MICQRCLRRPQGYLFSRSNSVNRFSLITRTITTRSATDTAPTTATSSGAFQFSTPLTRTPDRSQRGSSTGAQQTPVSSVPAGTPLKGLAYIKNRPEPVAEEDSAYPPWLWRCLDDGAGGGKGGKKGEDGNDGGQGDLFSKSKKQRRLAAKALRKAQARDPETLVAKVPLEEQSVDLPTNADGSVEGALSAGESRDEITRRLRETRRAAIKESNFLKGMR
ncbi:MAG: hypothetical protein M1832_001335 [Thelocarpon impressellum]|nr:MAG: hypothetical protein M1832_001335 [Thelocarpon impressellum]